MTGAEGGSPSLNDVRTRVELIAARVREAVRAKAPRRPAVPPHRTACRLCRRQGHTPARCPLRALDMWTNGRDVYLARHAHDAADILRARWHAPMARPRQGDWYLLAADHDERFTIAGVTATLKAWARANGRGELACDGALCPGRKVPR